MNRKVTRGLAVVLAVCLMILGAAAESGDTVTISREEYERYRQFDELLELMDAADLYFYKDVDRTKMLEGASAGLLSGLGDPYSFYYNPEDWEKMWEDDKGEYAGIGILISSNYTTGLCTISRVFKNSPSEAAGVRRGDILYKVNDDLYVTPETLQDAVDIMRGTPGTTVDVTFLRNGEFAGKCDEEFEAALNSLAAQGAKSLIIDLRDNPGGWVDSAQRIGDLFLDAGDLCYLVYKDGEEDHCYPTRAGRIQIPMVVLVNENSASASEIFAGAVREKAGATLVGVNTYGKGIVQVVLPVGSRGSGFQMTVAEYRTPEGAALHGVGLKPDVEIPLEEGDNGGYDFADVEHDPQLKKALEVMLEKMDEDD